MVCVEYKGQYINLIPLSSNYTVGQHRSINILYCLYTSEVANMYFYKFPKGKSLGENTVSK